MNFEPSRLKLWEIVRRYDPIHIAAYLYILENVLITPKRKPIACSYKSLARLCKINHWNQDLHLEDGANKNLRITRYEKDVAELFDQRDHSKHDDRHPDDIDIMKLLTCIRNSDFIENANIYVRILVHNFGTPMYQRFLHTLPFLLFTDNLQIERNEIQSRDSVAIRYLRFYKMLNHQKDTIDPRNMRFLILRKPERIYEKLTDLNEKYLIQPLYQGIHTIVNVSENSIKIYNRYAEHYKALNHKLDFENDSFTFEAIIVPRDKYGNLRSWRYWRYRADFVFYVVDVFRYRSELLTNMPFSKRRKYARLIRSRNARQTPIVNWDHSEHEYYRRSDIYDPIVGLIIRRRDGMPNERLYEYRFNISTVFDLRSRSLVRLVSGNEIQNINVHFNNEMADHRTTCIAYAHTETKYYICAYNASCHQFEHCATLTRLPHDTDEPRYKSTERLLILNARTTPRGVVFLRIYYDKFYTIVGYEIKPTIGRFSIPLHDRLLDRQRVLQKM